MQIINIFSGFSVNSLEDAKEFYGTLLGLAIKQDQMGLHISLPTGGEIFVYEKTDHSAAEYTVLNLVVNSIDAAIDELAAKGIEFLRYPNLPAPQDTKGVLRGKAANMGPDIAWFTDPSRNIIAILEP